MPGYTNVNKPTGANYSNINPEGKKSFDDASITYNDSSTSYDGINQSIYTNISKPVSSVYTKITKPT